MYFKSKTVDVIINLSTCVTVKQSQKKVLHDQQRYPEYCRFHLLNYLQLERLILLLHWNVNNLMLNILSFYVDPRKKLLCK